ncbi:hypothetical protein [Lysobacter sp. CA199]|uniref:hypothetical protein n=1 Tax=Lysobacter sp. CA199 TaxID=3455608 RepID=UPI003F8D0F72
MSEALSRLLDRLGQDPDLERSERLRDRIQALDRLERLGDYLPDTPSSERLREHLAETATRLDAANERLYRDLRAQIRLGDFSGVRAWLSADGAAAAQGEAYDHLDALLGGVLQLSEPDGEVAPPRPEMVFYQPTPARHIVDLIGRLALRQADVLIDLGSGLGHVPLLVGLCTPARCIGVELEPAYVASARRSADDLGLRKVSFVQGDARAADLSQATVFYLYTPFTGGVMAQMLERIRAQARSRDIRVCSLGPCTQVLARQSWLRSGETALRGDRIAVFQTIA